MLWALALWLLLFVSFRDLLMAKPTTDLAAARIWKLMFAGEFARYTDVDCSPNFLQKLTWIISETDAAFDRLDDPLSMDSIEQAREAARAIGLDVTLLANK